MNTYNQIGVIIVKHLGSKNPDYPDDSYTSRKFTALAKDLAQLFRETEKLRMMIPQVCSWQDKICMNDCAECPPKTELMNCLRQ